MKLRVQGDSMRLRITPSEMRKFIEEGRIADTIHFAPAPEAQLTYALEHGPSAAVTLRYTQAEATVLVPTIDARAWADSNEVGIYASVSNGHGMLEVAVEKDWACLSGSDADNADTFPNPNEGATC